MTPVRPQHLQEVEYREIGLRLFKEMYDHLRRQKIVAVLGPSNGGKRLVVERVREMMQTSAIPAAERPLIVSLDWRHPKPITGQQILGQFAAGLQLDSLPEEEWTPETKYKDKMISLLRKASVATGTRRFCFFMEGILNVPNRHARDLLDALVDAGQLAGGARFEISACITGSADFIPLCLGMNSPLRDHYKYLAVRMDKECAREVFMEHQISKAGITEEAFDYLYSQICGSPFLIREFVKTTDDLRPGGTDNPPTPWSPDLVMKRLDELTEDHLTAAITLRAMVHGIGSNRDSFDIALRMLESPKSEGLLLDDLEKEFHDRADLHSTLLHLEVFEFARHSDDGKYLLCSSPVMAAVMRRMFDPGFIADSLALQGRWDEAWKTFREMDPDLVERPVSGPARFRQRDLIPDWSDHLLIQAPKGPAHVLQEFVFGANYILGFPVAGLAMIDGDKAFWQTILGDLPTVEPFVPQSDTLDETFHDQSDRAYSVLYNHGFRNRIVCFDLQFYRLDPRESHPILVLERPIESAVSHAEYNLLAHALNAFLNAYDLARRQEYDGTAGLIRERHLAIVEEINKSLFTDPISMEKVAQEAVEALVCLGKYRRVQVSFVNEQRTRIEDVPNETCPFPALSKYDLDKPGSDVLPWVVYHRRAAFIEDAKVDPRTAPDWREGDLTWNHEMAKMIAPPMEGISVVPMVVGQIKNPDDPIIGAIHFEREDGKLPADYERELMFGLARQIAAIFHLTKRLIPRAQEKAATQTLGEFTHMLSHTIPIALSRLSEAQMDLEGRDQSVRSLVLEAHQLIRGAMAFIQAVEPVASVPLAQKRELSVRELVSMAEKQACVLHKTLYVETSVDGGCDDCVVAIDPDLLLRVVEILADNAVFHNQDTGAEDCRRVFRIVARRRRSNPREAQILFWNEGRSIPPSLLSKVFEYGFTTHINGSGIGLATAQRILHAHGGSLVADDPGERGGALFLMSLPCIDTGGD